MRRLRRESFVLCDNLVSIRKTTLTRFIGTLSATKIVEIDRALAAALSLA